MATEPFACEHERLSNNGTWESCIDCGSLRQYEDGAPVRRWVTIAQVNNIPLTETSLAKATTDAERYRAALRDIRYQASHGMYLSPSRRAELEVFIDQALFPTSEAVSVDPVRDTGTRT